LRETDCPAVLLELGFMDSTTDVPIILTDKYAQQCAKAIVEILVKRGNLTKKKETKKETSGTIYRVQVGAFSKKENAEKLVKQLKAKGYDVFIV
jgi:N-acetylmuramoyl-L-alanine amidase